MKIFVMTVKGLHKRNPMSTTRTACCVPQNTWQRRKAHALAIVSACLCVQAIGNVPEEETVIESNRLEMISGESINLFLFEEQVRVRGTNLSATADRMEVESMRVGDPTGATVGQIGSIRRILLTGNVVIEQAGRQATAGRAELLPGEGKVILSENPVVVDAEGTVTGHRMTLLQGERRVLVEGAPDGPRPRVTLPAIQDLGYRDPTRDASTSQTDSADDNGDR